MPIWRYSRALATFLDQNVERYDIVHVHGIWTAVSLLAAQAAYKHKVPYIISPHGMLAPDALRRKGLKKAIYLRLVERTLFRRAALIHCITVQEQQHAARNLPVRATICVPNGVQVPEFYAKDYKKLDRVAFIGRIHAIKGLDRLIEALVSIPEVNLTVAGSGAVSYEKHIRRVISKYGLQNRVQLVGFADEATKEQIFRDALFTVVPSFSEVLALVSLESMASSTPVLVSKQCNFDDVEKYCAGIVIKDNKPATIREGIQRMLASDIAQMSHNAYRLATEKYELTTVAAALSNAYVRVVSAKDN
jgi:glycosyltransferase involved in cell wall biosynthesis